MIDFRYHLVSLISVFLALAVGIVLGAGPLQETLGDQLAGQVEQLRTETEELRTNNEQLRSENDQLTAYARQSAPHLVAGGLHDKRVAVITDAATTRPALDQVVSLLDTAEVSSTTRVALQPALWDPAQASDRSEAVEEIRTIAPDAPLGDQESGAQLASAVVFAISASEEELSPQQRTDMWEVLQSKQLVSVEGDEEHPVDAILFAAAAPADHVVSSDTPDAANVRAQNLLNTHTGLLSAIANRETPAVLSAVTTDNDASASIIRTARSDSQFSNISTTDRLQETDGPALAVLALIEQAAGGVGNYGTAAGAEQRLPPHTTTQPDDAAGTEDSGQDVNGSGTDGSGTNRGSGNSGNDGDAGNEGGNG